MQKILIIGATSAIAEAAASFDQNKFAGVVFNEGV